jgi:predicted nucleic-acid-binding protein
MIALDTNILARLLLKDDVAQFMQVCELLSRSDVYTAPPTVILELVWVLESSDYTRDEVTQGLRALLGLPNFKPKSFEALFYAINWYESGMDFGDALHLALSEAEQTFVTFDKALGKLATKHGIAPKIQVLKRS